MNIEKEYKTLINSANYQTMMDFYQVKARKQVNYYFDTPEGLFNKNLNVRIRQIDDQYFFTLKHYQGQLYEYEFEISSLSIDDLNVQKLLTQFDIKNLKCIGSLTTYRAMIKDTYGELCIDKNLYFDQVDYEVEYELSNANEDHLDHFKNILNQFNISFIGNKVSKSQRFQNILKQTTQ
ncbi:MAG: CYTH domain-containing protein [Erysipelotrichaceae bacterium]